MPVDGWVVGVDGVVVGGRVVVVVGAAATVTVNTADVDAAKLALPAYTAVSWCVPAPSADVVKTAGECRAAVPSDVVPSKNSTVPNG